MMISQFSSFLLLLAITFTIHSYPLTNNFNLDNLPTSQIDRLCSYLSRRTSTPEKRFVMPFPDMHRFLSTSHKLHHPTSENEPESKTAHDFHAYLCSIPENSEEMTNFISIFIEEHGEEPAVNLFESCAEVSKRDTGRTNFANQLSQVCSARVSKRWKGSAVEGPMAIDYIHQMLEARKVKSYPYFTGVDPYLVG